MVAKMLKWQLALSVSQLKKVNAICPAELPFQTKQEGSICAQSLAFIDIDKARYNLLKDVYFTPQPYGAFPPTGTLGTQHASAQ